MLEEEPPAGAPLSAKERARKFRREAYARAKAKRDQDPRYLAAKAARKLREKEARKAAKERRKAAHSERQAAEQKARDETLREMVRPLGTKP